MRRFPFGVRNLSHGIKQERCSVDEPCYGLLTGIIDRVVAWNGRPRLYPTKAIEPAPIPHVQQVAVASREEAGFSLRQLIVEERSVVQRTEWLCSFIKEMTEINLRWPQSSATSKDAQRICRPKELNIIHVTQRISSVESVQLHLPQVPSNVDIDSAVHILNQRSNHWFDQRSVAQRLHW